MNEVNDGEPGGLRCDCGCGLGHFGCADDVVRDKRMGVYQNTMPNERLIADHLGHGD